MHSRDIHITAPCVAEPVGVEVPALAGHSWNMLRFGC